MPAAGGSGSGSASEAPSGAGGHSARHRSSQPGQEWSAPRRAQQGRFRGGAGARPRRAGARCPRSFGPSVWLRRPAVQSPGCWRDLGCTLRGCKGGEAGGGRGEVVLPRTPVWGCGGVGVGSQCAGYGERSGQRVARKPPHATERLAPAARRQGGGSKQQPLLRAAWAGHW